MNMYIYIYIDMYISIYIYNYITRPLRWTAGTIYVSYTFLAVILIVENDQKIDCKK